MATILFAEDRAALREHFRQALQADGHIVETARNGVEALDLYSALRPDVVVLDLFMPRMNGFDALVHLRRLFPEALVVAITDASPIVEEALREAVALGADRALVKSEDPGSLLDTIGELLVTQ